MNTNLTAARLLRNSGIRLATSRDDASGLEIDGILNRARAVETQNTDSDMRRAADAFLRDSIVQAHFGDQGYPKKRGPKTASKTITLQCLDGARTVDAAVIAGEWAAHRRHVPADASIEATKELRKGWVITHVPTGLRACTTTNLDTARSICQQLKPLTMRFTAPKRYDAKKPNGGCIPAKADLAAVYEIVKQYR